MDSRTIARKLKFIEEYKSAKNAATGSKFDSNANVTQKNIATLQCELGKKDIIDLRRTITCNYLERDFGKEISDKYLEDLRNHIIYQNDESSLFPYCASISLYP